MGTEQQPQERARSISRTIGGCLLKILAFPVGVVALSMAYLQVYEHYATDRIDGEIPPSFPIVVVAVESGEHTAYMITYGALAQFKEQYPEASFTIPADKVNSLRWNIYERTKQFYRSKNWQLLPPYAHFSMRVGKDGRQRFKTSMPEDDDDVNEAWYEATASDIFPQKHLLYNFGPGILMAGMMWSALAMSAIYLALGGYRSILYLVRRINRGTSGLST